MAEQKGRTEVLINPTLELVVLKVTDVDGNLKAVVAHDIKGTETLIDNLKTNLEALRKAIAKKGQA